MEPKPRIDLLVSLLQDIENIFKAIDIELTRVEKTLEIMEMTDDNARVIDEQLRSIKQLVSIVKNNTGIVFKSHKKKYEERTIILRRNEFQRRLKELNETFNKLFFAQQKKMYLNPERITIAQI